MGPHLSPLPPGAHGLLSARAEPDLAARGYSEQEYCLGGTAKRFSGEMPADGRAALITGDVDDSASFATRVVVRAPIEGFSGTLFLEWLNVSSGSDAAPDWTFAAEEILRSGHAWAGVSAQYAGVEGGVASVTVGDLGAPGLRAQERYADLHHPGDAYCYDIFTRAGEAIGDLLDAVRVIAVGESQSATTLTTYANGVQPLDGLFDGFLIHSRPAVAAPLGEPGAGLHMDAVLRSHPVRIREDLDVPVLLVQAEGDLFDRIGYLPARQDDGPLLRLWEVAGAAHADRYVIGEFEELLGCTVPVNRGQQWAVVRAAVRALHRWVADGVAPPHADRIETTAEDAVRDRHGVARGGVRTPVVDAPAERNSGRAWPGSSSACRLFGSSTPCDEPAFTDAATYLAAYEAATDAAVAAGFVLPEDRDALLAEARPELVGAIMEADREIRP